MQGLLEEFNADVEAGDYGKGSFELIYVYSVSRDKVLSESEEFVFKYSGSSSGVDPDPDPDPDPAPASSSDWYLPSPKEIYIICTGDVDDIFYHTPRTQDNMLKLNKVLATIDGAQQLGTDMLSFYRTNAEASYRDVPGYEDKSYSMSFTEAMLSTNGKTFAQSIVRFVLAF